MIINDVGMGRKDVIGNNWLLRARRRSLTILSTYSRNCVHRTVWSKTGNNQWWEDIQRGRFGEEWRKEILRLSQDTFRFLCNELRPYIQHQTTCLKEPINVGKRVAITVWKLANNVEYRTLSHLFRIGRSTVSCIVAETWKTVSEKLMESLRVFQNQLR